MLSASILSDFLNSQISRSVSASKILQYLWKVILPLHSLNINQHQPNGWSVNINPGFGPLEDMEEYREWSPLEQTAEGKQKKREIFVDLISYIESQLLKKPSWTEISPTQMQKMLHLQPCQGLVCLYITLMEVNFALVSVVTEAPRGHESKPTDTHWYKPFRWKQKQHCGRAAHINTTMCTQTQADTHLHSLLCIHQMFLLNPRVGF